MSQESQNIVSVTPPTHLLGSAREHSPEAFVCKWTLFTVGCKVRLARVSCLPWDAQEGHCEPQHLSASEDLLLSSGPTGLGCQADNLCCAQEGFQADSGGAGSRGTCVIAGKSSASQGAGKC